MKKAQSSVALAAFILWCSACSANSVSQINNAQASALIANSSIAIEDTASSNTKVSPTPSINTTNYSGTASTASSVEPTNSNPITESIRFNEDNFTKYFQFGMSISDVIKRLEALHIGIINKTPDQNVQGGYAKINTECINFYFDSKNKLYEIEGIDYKSLKKGDSIEQMHLICGKEDEYDKQTDQYIYYKNGYMLAIYTSDINGKTVVSDWSYFVDIWNEPSNSNTAPRPASDDSIAFNENNFKKYFQWGMSHKELIKKLTNLGVRITWIIKEDANDDDYWMIYTDHVLFCVDFYTDRLYFIEVNGWDTAKGLKEGDSPAKLHKLYGKEYRYDKESYFYIYRKNGYMFKVCFGNTNPKGTDQVSSWSIGTDLQH